MTVENKNIYISYWLLLITFFVALMIVVGGLTRLTDSGLSITKWEYNFWYIATFIIK